MNMPDPHPRDTPRPGETGAALITALTVLVVLGVAVTVLMDRSRGNIRPWVQEAETAQAIYAAESGIAYQLYLERFSDSAEPSFGKTPAEDVTGFLSDPYAPTDSFAYRLDTAQGTPEVNVDRTRAFLDITSTGEFRNAKATIFARFGKALDDTIFGAALTLDNDVPLEPFPAGQVSGSVRARTLSPGMASLPWSQGFSVSAYIAEFTDKKYYALESSLQKKLSEEGGESGNGNFSPEDPPDFHARPEMAFTLGRVEIVNTGNETWVLKGPGRIFSEGEIRVRGRIRMDNLQLLSGKDVVFEDSVSGEDISVFARSGIFFHGRCRLGIEAVAGKDIILRDKSQTTPGSVLLSVGNRRAGKGADSLNAIRIVNEAVARGFLIAGGPNGRVVMGTAANVVEGVVMASAVWLSGEVRGPVLAQRLLCEGTNTRNCLGPGRINRQLLPVGFVQPLQLGPQDRRLHTFKLMDWRRM